MKSAFRNTSSTTGLPSGPLVAMAKVRLTNTDNVNPATVTCELHDGAGTTLDRSDTTLVPAGSGTISLTAAIGTSDGTVDLQCTDSGGGPVSADDIHIVVIEVGRLS